MARRRAWLAGALASAMATAGMTVVTATPAAAHPGNTTLTCALAGEAIECIIYDPEGVRSYRAVTVEEGAAPFTSNNDCTGPPATPSFGYNRNDYPKLRVFVTDCQTPRSHATVVVRYDGSVREIRNN